MTTRSLLTGSGAEALGHLPDREQMILRLRFGLDDGVIRAPREVGEVIGISAERIRQVESKALARLRRELQTPTFRDAAQMNSDPRQSDG